MLALRLINSYMTAGELPDCSSSETKDALSNIFKKANADLSRYIDIKTLTTAKDNITCNAILAKSAGGTLDIDYRIYFEEKAVRVLITRAEDKP